MAALQTWFAPLLWIIGTITAIVCFIKLCMPFFKNFHSSKDFIEKIDDILDKISKIDEKLVQQEEKLIKLTEWNQREDSITLTLLHDSIVQIYEQAKANNYISEVDYYRACELYKQNGNSQYIDSIMSALSEMHGKGLIEDV